MGFELLSKIEKFKEFNHPDEKVHTLAEIWYGHEIDSVREKHIAHDIDDVEICSGCAFKDTYEWIPVNNENSDTVVNIPEGLV